MSIGQNLVDAEAPRGEGPLPPGLAMLLRLGRDLRFGTLHVRLPGGTERSFSGSEPGPAAALTIHDGRVVRRFLTGGAVGFAESYIDGDWDSPDLAALLELLDRNYAAWSGHHHGGPVPRLLRRLLHLLRGNSRRGSRRNIHAHYDLGNDFFAAWLDPTLTYSSARFVDGIEDLEAAQIEKYRSLARLMLLAPGQKLLEIGSGWGSFAILAAREFGAQVRSLTISKEQHAFASRRVQELGLGDRVSIELCDYRDASGSYDRIASIEMFEAVGESWWPAYFGKLREVLVPGGMAGLQIITIADRYFAEYRRSADFIQRYIFPGGMLPSPTALAQQVERAGLTIRDQLAFGGSYARTLGIWNRSFDAAWEKVMRLGFDERFRRLWTYYLAYCEAGFRTGSTDVVQVAVARPA
ncbi:MAG TPA: cyclopropane-fatty-acyl-phospholipid synthase family protein [Geminicoccaceae bacterium]|nr:cyclopropane-fatty-acyl-phospholipid synthase family protein [Geminicoccus sp.]HMU52033.1 cyclopropane-fatty-acyl-phospholipid synthase family protein [Geminicoccaceae bacterium]